MQLKVCPACGEEKLIESRNTCCSMACGVKYRAQLHAQQVEERARAVDERFERFVSRVEATQTSPPPAWTARAGRKVHQVIPTAVLSDTHLDEHVDPAQVNHVNSYTRKIAEARLRRFFERSVALGEQYFSGLQYPGICMPMLGDILSGNIHEELRETNEDTIFGSVLHWVPLIAAGVKMLAEHYGNVFIPCVVGNHGRNTKKPISKGRVRDNFDWLIYGMLVREFDGDKRVRFKVSDSADCHYSLFDTRFCASHGDQFRGGSGISGLLSPLMIGDHRKRKRAQAIATPYDYLLIGHWHQLAQMKGVIVNGSLKGYDEYAFHGNFDYEPPQQA